MLQGKVVGTIVSTNKFDALRGYKFLEIQLKEKDELTDRYIIAVDRSISAGIGEEVLVVTGSAAARFSMEAPTDAAIVAILDMEEK